MYRSLKSYIRGMIGLYILLCMTYGFGFLSTTVYMKPAESARRQSVISSYICVSWRVKYRYFVADHTVMRISLPRWHRCLLSFTRTDWVVNKIIVWPICMFFPDAIVFLYFVCMVYAQLKFFHNMQHVGRETWFLLWYRNHVTISALFLYVLNVLFT